jgi:hypothetical protein
MWTNPSKDCSETVTRAKKNIKLELAKDSFKRFDEECHQYSDTSTMACSFNTSKSKSYELENIVDEEKSFQINLVNLSPRTKDDNPYAFDVNDIQKLQKGIQKGKA